MSAFKNYFSGIYIQLEFYIKKLYNHCTLLDNNAILLVWQLFQNFRGINEFTIQDVQQHIKTLYLNAVPKRDTIYFNQMEIKKYTFCIQNNMDMTVKTDMGVIRFTPTEFGQSYMTSK